MGGSDRGADDQPHSGFLVLADISGYTGFMAGTELRHAQDIVAELLELVVHRLTPALTLSVLEGDAVFAYAPDGLFGRGESLVELIESTYVGFRDHVETVHRRTTCDCRACRAVPTLDLKFLVHHGEYGMLNVAGSNELAGTAVNLAHRLLKNHVTEETGWRAYALYTHEALTCLNLSADGMHARVEGYEHLGDVQTYSTDLRAYYERVAQARHITIAPEEADMSFGCECAAPPAVVWDWLNDPAKRNRWMPATHWQASLRPGGRTTVGARNHCAHGKAQSVEEIVDWHPFDYVTSSTCDGTGKEQMIQTIRLVPLDGGARTQVSCSLRLRAPLPAPIRRVAAHVIMTRGFRYPQSYQLLTTVINEGGAGMPPTTPGAGKPGR